MSDRNGPIGRVNWRSGVVGGWPPARHGHTVAAVPAHGIEPTIRHAGDASDAAGAASGASEMAMLLFGGEDDGHYFDDLWVALWPTSPKSAVSEGQKYPKTGRNGGGGVPESRVRWLALDPRCRGAKPSGRSGAGVWVQGHGRAGSSVFVLGGFDGRRWLSDAHVLDTRSWSWSSLAWASPVPRLLGMGGVCRSREEGVLLVFGKADVGGLKRGGASSLVSSASRRADPRDVMSVFEVDLRRRTWELLGEERASNAPSSLTGTSVVGTAPGVALLHAGYGPSVSGKRATNYNFVAEVTGDGRVEWRRQHTRNSPAARCDHGCAAVSHGAVRLGPRSDAHRAIALIVFGGRDGRARMDDLVVLDPDENSWKDFNAVGGRPSPRSGHSVCVVGSRVVVYGGLGPPDSDPSADLTSMADIWWFNLYSVMKITTVVRSSVDDGRDGTKLSDRDDEADTSRAGRSRKPRHSMIRARRRSSLMRPPPDDAGSGSATRGDGSFSLVGKRVVDGDDLSVASYHEEESPSRRESLSLPHAARRSSLLRDSGDHSLSPTSPDMRGSASATSTLGYSSTGKRRSPVQPGSSASSAESTWGSPGLDRLRDGDSGPASARIQRWREAVDGSRERSASSDDLGKVAAASALDGADSTPRGTPRRGRRRPAGLSRLAASTSTPLTSSPLVPDHARLSPSPKSDALPGIDKRKLPAEVARGMAFIEEASRRAAAIKGIAEQFNDDDGKQEDEAQRDELDIEIHDLREEKRHYEKSETRASKTVERLQKKYQTLLRLLERRGSVHNESKGALADMESSVESLQERISQRRRTHSKKQKTSESLGKAVGQLTVQLAASTAEWEQQQEEARALADKVDDAHQRLPEKRRMYHKAKQRHESLNLQIATLQSRLHSLWLARKHAEGERDGLKERLSMLHDQLRPGSRIESSYLIGNPGIRMDAGAGAAV